VDDQQLIAKISEVAPGFFERFRQEMTSGHPERTRKAFEESIAKTSLALKSLGNNPRLRAQGSTVAVTVLLVVTITVTHTRTRTRTRTRASNDDEPYAILSASALEKDLLAMKLANAFAV
jgi:hypothetical protein